MRRKHIRKCVCILTFIVILIIIELKFILRVYTYIVSFVRLL